MTYSRRLAPLAAILFGACQHQRPSATPAPAAPAVASGFTVQMSANANPQKAPAIGWQLFDQETDHVPGIGVRRAWHDLLTDRPLQTPVLVAIIDAGIDTGHTELHDILWTDPAAPHTHGWNFIGGANGQDVNQDTYELTRLGVRCAHHDPLPDPWAARCPELKTALANKRQEAFLVMKGAEDFDARFDRAMAVLQHALGDSVNTAAVRALHPTDSATANAQKFYLSLSNGGVPVEFARGLMDGLALQRKTQLTYQLDTTFDPRSIVGDHYADVNESAYGNADVMGPSPMHGTHVAGIIATSRRDGQGLVGIAPARIMMIRAVPDGDERDKDIANAIRFAVDHGARVINMSFAKPYSPEKPAVDAAVRYAAAHDVLLVHAAGNDGANVDEHPTFPMAAYADSGRAPNWIEVGASSPQGGDHLAAPFSNYGHSRVDVFAPGVDIYSTLPGNAHGGESGTSMAAPVVTGLAALLLDYYPKLTAVQLRRIILSSATRFPSQMVVRPGSDTARVAFDSLSATGGIVNAYAALKMAAVCDQPGHAAAVCPF